MAASTITRAALTNGSTPWNVSTISSAVYDKIDEMFGGVGTYATLELGGALKINGALTQLTNDGGALGTSSLGWSDLFLASGGVINWNVGDVTITHSTDALAFAGAANGYTFANGPVRPATNDGAALGTTATQWSDLFLASGGVINFDNGDVTVTHTANTMTFAGATSGYIFNDGNLFVLSSAATASNAWGTGQIKVERDNFTGISTVTHNDTDGNAGFVQILRSRGTQASPTAVTSTQLIGVYGFYGYDGVNAAYRTVAEIQGYVDGTVSSAVVPGSLRFYTTNASGVLTEAARINAGQELLIGYTADQGAYRLQVNSQIFATNATIATSDGRFKTDVQPVREGLAAVKALQPVQFTWKKHPVHNFIDGTDVGFIAQDVRSALTGRDYTGAVVTTNGTGANEFLGMADAKLIPLLVAAVQELSAEVNALKAH